MALGSETPGFVRSCAQAVNRYGQTVSDSGLLGIGIRRLNEQVFEHLDEFMSRHTYIYIYIKQ